MRMIGLADLLRFIRFPAEDPHSWHLYDVMLSNAADREVWLSGNVIFNIHWHLVV